jgi:hypothetical protein
MTYEAADGAARNAIDAHAIDARVIERFVAVIVLVEQRDLEPGRCGGERSTRPRCASSHHDHIELCHQYQPRLTTFSGDDLMLTYTKRIRINHYG